MLIEHHYIFLEGAAFTQSAEVLQELPAQFDGIMEIAGEESSSVTLLWNCVLNIPFLDLSASLQGPKARLGKVSAVCYGNTAFISESENVMDQNLCWEVTDF